MLLLLLQGWEILQVNSLIALDASGRRLGQLERRDEERLDGAKVLRYVEVWECVGMYRYRYAHDVQVRMSTCKHWGMYAGEGCSET